MIYGYARVSSKDQCLDRQFEAMNQKFVIDRMFTDKQSGKSFDRAGYQEMKTVVKAGDEIVIEELDRLGRNKEEVKKELEWFRVNKIVVRILDIPTSLIDFQGQDWIRDMVNNILIEVLAAIAEQERLKIHKRQEEGIAAMKARGEWDKYGRPKANIDRELFENLAQKQKNGFMSVAQCCSELNISRGTWYNLLRGNL